MKFPEFELDETNHQLLIDLRKLYEIEFEVKDIEYCEVFTKNNKSIIFYNPRIVDNDSIAHELLHIWLNTFIEVCF
jgi:Zn-dependent peptidase ImmA (M78 family)